MRVALVIDAFGGGGGVDGYLRRLALFLRERGAEVELVVGRGNPDGPWRVRNLQSGGSGAAGRARAFADAFEALNAQRPWDVSLAVRPVRSADLYQPHGGLELDAAMARDPKAAWPLARKIWRRYSPLARAMQELEAAQMQRAKAVLAVSGLVVRQIEQRYADAVAKTELLALAIDHHVFTPRGAKTDYRARFQLADDAPLFVFAGYNARLKGLDEAIRALAREPELRKAHLLVAGVAKPPRLSVADTARLRGRIHMLGPLKEIAPAFREADALLHPTWYDPCSTVVLEALACGCPVVTTRRNGATEIESPSLAVIENPRDTRALAVAVTRLIEGGDALRRTAVAAVQTRAEREHFSKLLEVLRRYAPRAGSPTVRSRRPLAV
jgi:UDP-glucose:(heptosyl)LPS alpha-1,3-glucosyltransferase